jgi:hypothetical protein
LILYATNITPRLDYIVDFIGKELQAGKLGITSSLREFNEYSGPRINYTDTRISEKEIWIKPQGLLFETGIKDQRIECFEVNGHKAFFKTGGDVPFDIFSASFYLLSRYEEYLAHAKDMYGRYAHENSLAFKENFLALPLVNYWIENLKRLLDLAAPGSVLRTRYSRLKFLPTYDIDIAWSYKHKGWRRNTGGLFRSLLKGQWSMAKERWQVLRGKRKDPFDAYEWMDQLHERYQLKPRYFFLVPGKRGRYDKNISPSCKAMQELIREHAARYSIGIHPSWRSGDNLSLLNEEIGRLTALKGEPVVSSRQHYIRFNLPEGYRHLIDAGIKYDYSMGYGSINGFRASVASAFYWYDLEKEKQTGLELFPFCYMEANSFYEQKMSAPQALDEMRQFYKTVKSVNGVFITIWHNSFLGTDKLCAGWRDMYEHFIKEISADF